MSSPPPPVLLLLLLSSSTACGPSIDTKPVDVGVAEARKALTKPYRKLRLTDGTLQPELAQHRAGLFGEFLAGDPRQVVDVAAAADLFTRRQALRGRFVRLREPGVISEYFYEMKKPYGAGDEKLKNTETSIYAPLASTNGRVWLVSERLKSKDDPRAQEFLRRAEHVGVVRELYDVWDASLLYAGYHRIYGKDPEKGAVALDTETPPPPSAPLQVWVPVQEGDADVWVVGCETAPAAAEGFVQRLRNPTVDQMAERVVHKRGTSFKERVLLWHVDAKRFAVLLDGRDPCGP